MLIKLNKESKLFSKFLFFFGEENGGKVVSDSRNRQKKIVVAEGVEERILSTRTKGRAPPSRRYVHVVSSNSGFLRRSFLRPSEYALKAVDVETLESIIPAFAILGWWVHPPLFHLQPRQAFAKLFPHFSLQPRGNFIARFLFFLPHKRAARDSYDII